jgi:hypothetical protein
MPLINELLLTPVYTIPAGVFQDFIQEDLTVTNTKVLLKLSKWKRTSTLIVKFKINTTSEKVISSFYENDMRYPKTAGTTSCTSYAVT